MPMKKVIARMSIALTVLSLLATACAPQAASTPAAPAPTQAAASAATQAPTTAPAASS
jgi:hypothetical protein